MRLSITFLFILFFGISSLRAQRWHAEHLSQIDVLQYDFHLELADKSDKIEGSTAILYTYEKDCEYFELDLVEPNLAGKGMKVSQVTNRLVGPQTVKYAFTHEKEKLRIERPGKKGEKAEVLVEYAGIPADGLIIGKNKYGNKTFFGDNWPNRAHHWLPVVDHPSDKAKVTFSINAPEQFEVIATGAHIGSKKKGNGMMHHYFQTMDELSTKIMVIGAADFAIDTSGYIGAMPVTAWTFPEASERGFKKYKDAVAVMEFFCEKLGRYPWTKLANVQSKTRYGGMENAGNVFYYEASATDGQDVEDLIAHELAHQWFGNSASEADWHHIWLSEGFATYLADLYMGHDRGEKFMKERLRGERKKAMGYEQIRKAPIVDTTVTNYNKLLNPNSYEKGAWVLRMLHREVGDSLFWKGIYDYHKKYQYSNAVSSDFQKVMEEVSGQQLEQFFQQWLYVSGHPKVNINWSYNKKTRDILMKIEQTQDEPTYNLLLDLEIQSADGEPIRKSVRCMSKITNVAYNLPNDPTNVVADPDVFLYGTFKVVQE